MLDFYGAAVASHWMGQCLIKPTIHQYNFKDMTYVIFYPNSETIIANTFEFMILDS